MTDWTFTDADIGKRVVRGNGEPIGRVVAVEDGVPYVDPDPDIVDTVQSQLGWEDREEDAYPLLPEQVSEVDEDEIRLGGL